jgi:hypothetical protein
VTARDPPNMVSTIYQVVRRRNRCNRQRSEIDAQAPRRLHRRARPIIRTVASIAILQDTFCNLHRQTVVFRGPHRRRRDSACTYRSHSAPIEWLTAASFNPASTTSRILPPASSSRGISLNPHAGASAAAAFCASVALSASVACSMAGWLPRSVGINPNSPRRRAPVLGTRHWTRCRTPSL